MESQEQESQLEKLFKNRLGIGSILDAFAFSMQIYEKNRLSFQEIFDILVKDLEQTYKTRKKQPSKPSGQDVKKFLGNGVESGLVFDDNGIYSLTPQGVAGLFFVEIMNHALYYYPHLFIDHLDPERLQESDPRLPDISPLEYHKVAMEQKKEALARKKEEDRLKEEIREKIKAEPDRYPETLLPPIEIKVESVHIKAGDFGRFFNISCKIAIGAEEFDFYFSRGEKALINELGRTPDKGDFLRILEPARLNISATGKIYYGIQFSRKRTRKMEFVG